MLRYSDHNGWLLDCYTKVPYPFAFTEFYNFLPYLAQYGSKRAFDIYEEELDAPGLEFSFVQDATVTKTKLDKVDRIANDTCQLLGENLMVLIEGIVTKPEFHDRSVSIYLIILHQ